MVEKSQFWAEQVDGSIFSIPIQMSSVSGKVEKEILIASVHLSQAFFPSIWNKELKSFYMVEFDTSKRENRWIEVVAVRWGNKLGRRCLALLNIKMYYACSLAKRKRDAPTYEDSFSSIVVDEKNAVKASSKLLKLFIFFWDLNLDAATEERIDKSTAFTETE